MPTLNRLQLRDAVLGRRFPASSQATNALRWIDTAYADVWTALQADGRMWSFELVFRANFAVTASATPTMPADFADAIELRDDAGNKLQRLSAQEFSEEFGVDSSGGSWAYTVANRQIHLGPTPGASATFKLTYRRRLSHFQSNQTTVVAGFMDEDGDYPLWPDHHGILIPRATAIGLQEVNDPTWQAPQEEYERQLARMRADLEHTEPQTQWPAASWY